MTRLLAIGAIVLATLQSPLEARRRWLRLKTTNAVAVWYALEDGDVTREQAMRLWDGDEDEVGEMPARVNR